jgi:hypothetical protein
MQAATVLARTAAAPPPWSTPTPLATKPPRVRLPVRITTMPVPPLDDGGGWWDAAAARGGAGGEMGWGGGEGGGVERAGWEAPTTAAWVSPTPSHQQMVHVLHAPGNQPPLTTNLSSQRMVRAVQMAVGPWCPAAHWYSALTALVASSCSLFYPTLNSSCSLSTQP